MRVSNQSDLAYRLGCSRIAINKWLNDHQYAEKRPAKEPNGTYLVEKYKPWMEYHELNRKLGKEDELEVSYQEGLKIKLLEIKVEKERMKLEAERGELVERALVSEVLGNCIGSLFQELDRVFGDEIPPQARGLTEKQHSALSRKELRAVFNRSKEALLERLAALENGG